MAKHAYEDGLDAIQPHRIDFGISEGSSADELTPTHAGNTNSRSGDTLERTNPESMQAILHHSLGLT
eukprot:CAMPEP_0194370444 /NCGR_PEP_ID=MMETSP0174-20130528/18736_1 /TAXON_ID=216777 /ORGANISM="Proboscia alata, Strain PI-D3" /LENGTH=66 /DNA_ID=CAMNT_0039147907 /DNA_START=270 /DNA_END=470 /DNA_ORIENTATION=-